MLIQPYFIIVTLISLVILLFLGILLWIQKNAKKRALTLLSKQSEEINAQKIEIQNQRDEINATNRDLNDSIKYASKIQNAILPSSEILNQVLPGNFVFYKPRDIVSGDFYWVWPLGNKVVIAVADCTGHGVPGAFMSVLGFSLLSQVVGELTLNEKELKASEILDKLRIQLIASLHQTGEIGEHHDGMDMSLCIYDKSNRIIQFSGANTYLYKYGKEEFKLVKGDRMPVSYFRKKEIPFTNHIIEAKPGEMFYLTTDGIIDQFGGPNGRKFRQESFTNILVEIYAKLPEDQLKELDYQLQKWMGSYKQIDDILVLGWRVI